MIAPSKASNPLLNPPNLLSLMRLGLTPLVAWCVLNDACVAAAALFVLVIFSDFFDGILARRLRLTSRLGTLLDHGADFVFVTTIISTGVILGLVTWLLPALIVVAFSQYLLDSRVLAGRSPRPSLLGRCNGIAYFVLSGAIIVVPCSVTGASAAVSMLALALAASTTLSIALRAGAVLRT